MLEIDFFSELRQFLVVRDGSVAQYLLKRHMSILSLSMDSESLIALAASLKEDEYGLTSKQIYTIAPASYSRPALGNGLETFPRKSPWCGPKLHLFY